MARVKIPLTKKDVGSIEAMAGHGLTVEQIAHVLGMSKKTLYRRLKDTAPELGASDSLDRGRAIAIATVSQTAYELAWNGKEPGMTQFWLQCRAGWKKTDGLELTGAGGGPVVTETRLDPSLLRDPETRAAALLLAEKMNAKAREKTPK